MSIDKTIPILIADDEALMRQLLASILRGAGYSNIHQVQDGRQALAALADPTAAIGIAFLDIDMPGLTGLEVMGMARVQLPDCFFVIVSAHSGIGNVLAALGDGARGFIVKPYTAQKIHDIMHKYETGAAT